MAMKNAVTCDLVETSKHQAAADCLLACYLDLGFGPENGGNTLHRNVSKLLPDYKNSHPKNRVLLG
jgi:hypothetical protein